MQAITKILYNSSLGESELAAVRLFITPESRLEDAPTERGIFPSIFSVAPDVLLKKSCVREQFAGNISYSRRSAISCSQFLQVHVHL